jgi:hypothetical protein
VNSSFLSFVQIGETRISNCKNENRLSFNNWKHKVPQEKQDMLRKLEILEPLASMLTERRTRLAVEINLDEPRIFELGRGYIRLGKDWLNDEVQTRRALIMGVMHTEFPDTYSNQFQLETMTDFLTLTIFGDESWTGEDGEEYSLTRDMKFATAAPSFDQYCQSPFRSLSHVGLCAVSEDPEDSQANVWGLRPLLAVSLKRVYDKLSLKDQLHMMQSLKAGVALPLVSSLGNSTAEGLVKWFQETLDEHVHALVGHVDSKAVNRTLKELEVESPTHWELTMDVTNTPAWREIFEQMRQRSQYMKNERVLVFTPEGAKALPSGLPVAWAADEISSQKHVLIACKLPSADEAIHVRARQMFAQQSCGKISRQFWE